MRLPYKNRICKNLMLDTEILEKYLRIKISERNNENVFIYKYNIYYYSSLVNGSFPFFSYETRLSTIENLKK